MEANYPNEKEIYLAGGCFWGVEGYFDKIPGVISTEVGYANGEGDETSYQQIHDTHHAETVHVKYDKNTISLAELLAHYFRIIDPVSKNKQGNDVGTQYRTGIYYRSDEDLKIIDQMMALEQKKYDQPLAVEVEPLKNFVLGEDYHQDYLKKNPGGYCHINLSLADEPLEEKEYTIPSDEELKKKLSDIQYQVVREQGTEAPGTGEYNNHYEKGIYVDIVTGEPLFVSSDKFDSGCGWPSFSKPITTGSIEYHQDHSHGMNRTEVVSKGGKSHLGHVFNDGPKDQGGLRYCINSASLKFIPLEEMAEQGYEDYIPYVE
ncbi:MAG: peptide-methionine (R)-S-oxide reductase MsrB [Tissierellia bacterium]|nr:peptide-methionine (R)-S-oxide reductase MsrB [Tissierellia bacterium]